MDMIHFTEAALEAICTYRANLHVPENHSVRVGIRQKNEQNKRLLIGFDEKTDKDREAVIEGMSVIYAPGEIFFFAGMTIDYREEDGRKGFTFVESKGLR